MFGRGPKKTLDEMTNREIISSIIGFSGISSLIIVASIVSTLRDNDSYSLVWNGCGILVASAILAAYLPRAFAELRRRRKKL